MQLHIISQPHVWLASGRRAIIYITIVHVWGVLPLVSLIFLAGLQSIPDEVYSASSVDGAGPWRQFRHITLPLLRPSIAIALTVGTLLAITIFDEIYVLNGTALNTRSILIQVYNTTFIEADFAHGTALAFLLAGVTAVLGSALRAGAAEVDRMILAGLADHQGVAMLLILVWSLAPIALGISTSVSTQREVNAVPDPLGAAATRHSSAYQRPAERLHRPVDGRHGHAGRHFVHAMTNSARSRSAGPRLALVVATMAAYAFGRLRFRFSGAVLALLVGTLIIPIFVIVIGLFQIMANAQLIDTKRGLMLVFVATQSPLATWLLYTQVRELPREPEEAALIDGCRRWQAFVRVVVPQMSSGIAAVAAIMVLSIWGEFLIPLLLTSTMNAKPGDGADHRVRRQVHDQLPDPRGRRGDGPDPACDPRPRPEQAHHRDAGGLIVSGTISARVRYQALPRREWWR